MEHDVTLTLNNDTHPLIRQPQKIDPIARWLYAFGQECSY
jgi:hypothetical protein